MRMRWLAAVFAIAVETACDGSSPNSADACQSVSPAGCPPGRCASVLAAALRQCSGIGGGVVQLAGGIYHLNDSNISSGGPMISLSGLSNVSVVGSADHLRPSLLLIHGSRSGLQLTESHAITLANLELDMARYPYTFGTATAVTNTSFELAYAATQYPFASQVDAPWQYEASSIMGFDTQQWRMANDPVVDLQGSFKLMPVKARNTASSTNRVIVTNGAGAHQGIVAGNSFVLRHRQLGCGGFCFASCSNVHMRNVKVWTAAGVAVWFGFSRDITLRHVEVRRRQGRPMSSIADASHFDSCGGHVLVEGNHFEGQGDDGMNIHSTMHEIRAIDPNISGRFWLGSKPSAGSGVLSPLTVGGSYTFRNRKTWATEAVGRLRAASLQNSTNETNPGHLPPGVPQQVADFTFAPPGDAAHVSRFAMLSDQSMEPSAVIVRNGYFGLNRARGALLKSSNTLVENTVFNHTASHCIQAYPDGCWWFEGDAFANWTLRNNTFLGCGAEATQADIFVAACAPTWNAGQPLETPSTGGPVREGQPFANVTVIGNMFVQDTPHVALQLFGSDGLRLVNNTVACIACRQLESDGRHDYKHAATATARSSASRPLVQNKNFQIQPSPVSGHLDSVDLAPSGGTLSGWVVDPALSFPGPVSSNVTLIVDGVPVLQALASLPRPDLVPRIAPQPQHGFQIKLPRELARNLLSLRRGANHTISMSALRSTNGTQHVFSTACVGAYRPTCGLPPDWRGVHPSSCSCETPWPPRLQISNSIRCQVKHNICDGDVCGDDAMCGDGFANSLAATAAVEIGCAPCSATDSTQDFTLDPLSPDSGLRHSGSTLCANASCNAALPAGCWPVRLVPCKDLTREQRFLNYTGPGGNIMSLNGHALDYGTYCPGCPPQLGLGNPAAVAWEEWSVDAAAMRVHGSNCCLSVVPPSPPPPPPPPPYPPPPTPSQADFKRRWCPRYHASKGTDPSGALFVNGEYFIFPDGSDDNQTIPPHHYGSKDLLRWKRYSMGWETDTGSITVTKAGTFRFWPQGGLAGPIARAKLLGDDPTLSKWSAATTVVPIPVMSDGLPVANFRDPSRAMQHTDGFWYMAVGSDTGDSRLRNSSKDFAKDGTAALRLFRASDESLSNWSAAGVPWVQRRTQGWVNYTRGEYNATGVAPPPFLECPDLFVANNTVVLLASYNDFAEVPSQGRSCSPGGYGADGQSAEWRTGALVVDPSFVGEDGLPGLKFVSKQQGVLDYGGLYAQKTAADAQHPNSGRRVLFGFTGWHERQNGLLNALCGYSHIMPRDLRVDVDGRMLLAPVPEVANLKLGHPVALPMDGAPVVTTSQVLANVLCDGLPQVLPENETVAGGRYANADVFGRNAVGVDVLLDDASAEWTRIGFDLEHWTLFVDQTHSNAHQKNLSDAYQTSASLSSVIGHRPSSLNITVLVDGGLIESFVNDRVAITSLLSPSTSGSSDADVRKTRAFIQSTVWGGSDSAGGKRGIAKTALKCHATATRLQSLPARWLAK